MEIKTHLLAHNTLLGTPIEVEDGKSATVQLVTIENMVVDKKGLVHGGFIFGLANYAAMLAVNDPNVVIAGAKVRFTAPVKRSDIMVAEATVVEEVKRKRVVSVEIRVDEKVVLTGELICYLLDRYVLD